MDTNYHRPLCQPVRLTGDYFGSHRRRALEQSPGASLYDSKFDGSAWQGKFRRRNSALRLFHTEYDPYHNHWRGLFSLHGGHFSKATFANNGLDST